MRGYFHFFLTRKSLLIIPRALRGGSAYRKESCNTISIMDCVSSENLTVGWNSSLNMSEGFAYHSSTPVGFLSRCSFLQKLIKRDWIQRYIQVVSAPLLGL